MSFVELELCTVLFCQVRSLSTEREKELSLVSSQERMAAGNFLALCQAFYLNRLILPLFCPPRFVSLAQETQIIMVASCRSLLRGPAPIPSVCYSVFNTLYFLLKFLIPQPSPTFPPYSANPIKSSLLDSQGF